MLNKVTDKVSFLNCEEKGDRPVIGLIKGDRYSLIIDGGNSESHAVKFLSNIDEKDKKKLKCLAITHWHWDHVFGAQYMGAVNVANSYTADKLKWMKDLNWTDEAIHERVVKGEEIEFCEENILIEHPVSSRKILIPDADIIFQDELCIDLGGVTAQLLRIQCDHSDDSTIIIIPEEKVVFLGDSLYMNMYCKEWSYTETKIHKLLDKLCSIDAEYYIPSHHGMYTKYEFSKFKDYLYEICDISKKSQNYVEAEKEFINMHNRKPAENERADIAAFINGKIFRSSEF